MWRWGRSPSRAARRGSEPGRSCSPAENMYRNSKGGCPSGLVFGSPLPRWPYHAEMASGRNGPAGCVVLELLLFLLCIVVAVSAVRSAHAVSSSASASWLGRTPGPLVPVHTRARRRKDASCAATRLLCQAWHGTGTDMSFSDANLRMITRRTAFALSTASQILPRQDDRERSSMLATHSRFQRNPWKPETS